MNCNVAHDRSMDHRKSLWHSIDQNGYTYIGYRRLCTLISLTAHQAGVAVYFCSFPPSVESGKHCLAPCIHHFLGKPAPIGWSLWNTSTRDFSLSNAYIRQAMI